MDAKTRIIKYIQAGIIKENCSTPQQSASIFSTILNIYVLYVWQPGKAYSDVASVKKKYMQKALVMNVVLATHFLKIFTHTEVDLTQ